MVGASSDDDDVPIVQTLSQTSSDLSVLATLATTFATSPKLRKKRAFKSLWTYVPLHEPTGVSSNYWDTNAPAVRTTKRLAKEKITAMHQGEGNNEGMHPALYRLAQKSTKEQSISIGLIDCGSEDGSSHHGSQDYGSEDTGSRHDGNQMKVKETSTRKRIRSGKAMLSPRVQKKPKTIKKLQMVQ